MIKLHIPHILGNTENRYTGEGGIISSYITPIIPEALVLTQLQTETDLGQYLVSS